MSVGRITPTAWSSKYGRALRSVAVRDLVFDTRLAEAADALGLAVIV